MELIATPINEYQHEVEDKLQKMQMELLNNGRGMGSLTFKREDDHYVIDLKVLGENPAFKIMFQRMLNKKFEGICTSVTLKS